MASDTRTSREPSREEGKLVFRTGPSRGKVLVLEKDRVLVGRAAECDVVVPETTVSARHAVIGREPDGSFWVRDEGSKNGTWLNGRRIERVEPLRDQDVFCLAQAGPEVQFTTGVPQLPSLLGTSTASFARTGTFSALRELLPQSGQRRIVAGAGVRDYGDGRLEATTRRSRRAVLSGVVAATALGLLAALVVLQVLERVEGPAPAPGGVVRPAGPASPLESVESDEYALELELEPVYGSLFYSYRNLPIGRVRIENRSTRSLSGARLAFDLFSTVEGRRDDLLVEGLDVAVPAIEPGGEWSSELRPVLSQHILASRDREVTAAARLSSAGGLLASRTKAALIYGHHVLSWSDPRRVAAFVDTEDRRVRAFLRAAWPARPESSAQEFPPRSLVDSVTLLEALAERGLSYRRDARTPSTFDPKEGRNDRVNYPGETLWDGTGDCDDFSVLGCALLEAAGTPTLLAVGADHVLFLFDSGFPAGDAEASPFREEAVVPWKGRLWIPVEATRLAGSEAGFKVAWTAAARYRPAILDGEMQLVEIREAWKEFKPFNPPPAAGGTTPEYDPGLDGSRLRARVATALGELKELYLQTLSGKVEALGKKYEGLAREHAVGLLYARSGLLAEASRTIAGAVFGERVPSSPTDLLAWKGEIDGAREVLLEDLAVVWTRAARRSQDLDMAAACWELALRGVPPRSARRGELLLRLALAHRLRGDFSAERHWSSLALEDDPGLEELYRRLIRGDGTVAGSDSPLSRYLGSFPERDRSPSPVDPGGGRE